MLTWNGIPGPEVEVYTLDGHLVGTAAEAWPEEHTGNQGLTRATGKAGSGYFRLTGFKGANLYIPFTAMADYAGERIRLRVTRKALGQQGWEQRPSALPPAREGGA